MAVSQRFVSRSTNERREEVVFVAITVWGKQAEACGEYLTKGSSLFVEGRLQLDTWESKDGQKRNRLRVVAQRVQFIGRPRTAAQRVTGAPQAEEERPQEAPSDVPLNSPENISTEETQSSGEDERVPF